VYLCDRGCKFGFAIVLKSIRKRPEYVTAITVPDCHYEWKAEPFLVLHIQRLELSIFLRRAPIDTSRRLLCSRLLRKVTGYGCFACEIRMCANEGQLAVMRGSIDAASKYRRQLGSVRYVDGLGISLFPP